MSLCHLRVTNLISQMHFTLTPGGKQLSFATVSADLELGDTECNLCKITGTLHFNRYLINMANSLTEQ